MNLFYLARHGKTINNRDGRLSGWIDTPLTEDGLEPTARVIEKLRSKPIDSIYASDLGRAFITAYTISRGLQLDKEIVKLPGLREVNYGLTANMKSAEVYAQYPLLDRDTHFTPPEGESLDHMQARVLSTVLELDRQHSDATILLVAHSGVMAALNASYTGQDFGEHNISEAYPHDYVAQFTVEDEKVTSFAEVVRS